VDTLQDRYFNKLIAEMRGRTRGTTLDQPSMAESY
jgi:hypothetical protein